ncbi:unannotated protein [freshwater metagenome]|uniref:Unannotated protein n=1 Tax=freshwater metagenome TaxID=449393 RepID=A0A6J6LVD1_9ZZZZ
MTNRLRLAILITAISAVVPLAVADETVVATNTTPLIKSESTKMTLVQTINGQITPKSVRASGNGIVSAHNMMYRHSITFYDAKTYALLATVPDSVELAKFGFTQYSGSYKGAPVEGAFSPDGKYLYVSNYAMYGKGFNHEGHDTCSPASGFDRSFLYRIDLASYAIDAVYQVGVVPKVVEVTPDNKYILVSHWCSYDLRIISIETQKVVKTLKIGAYPRGITVSPDGQTAYVAQMGGTTIHQISLKDFSERIIQIGLNPRAIVLSPDGKILYATLNSSGKVTAYDLVKHKKIGTVTTGKAARSLAISTDGTALFVVNFESDTMSKVRTSDMKVLQTVKACNQPIGVTYEPTTDRTWVACYLGQIKVYENS